MKSSAATADDQPMIDDRVLGDPSRCPSCAADVRGATSCRSCGVSLSSATAAELWRVSVEATGLLDRRARLVDRLRSEAVHPYAGAQPATTPPPAPGLPPLTDQARPARPAPEWTRRRVQNLLLGLGVTLLAVAAVIFLVVSWGTLGVGGRAAVMAGCTALAAGAALVTHRRGLDATAEALGLLAVVLSLLDAYGARASGLAGLDAGDGPPYWAGALALVSAAAGLGSVGLPLRSLRLSAAVLGQLPIPLVTVHLASTSGQPVALVATGLALQSVLALLVTFALSLAPPAGDARAAVAGGSVLAWAGAVAAAGVAAYAESGSMVLGSLLLVLLAAAAAAAGALAPVDEWQRTVVLGAASVTAVLAAWAPLVELIEGDWLPVALAGAALLMLAATGAVPRPRRTGPVAVVAAAALGPGLAALEPVAIALLGPLTWLSHAWTGGADDSARGLIGAGSIEGLDWPWDGGPELPLLLLLVAAAGLLLAALTAGWRAGLAPAVPFVTLAAVMAPLALDLGYPVAVAGWVAVAAALLAGGPAAVRAGEHALGWSLTSAGVVVLAEAVAWSFAVDVVNLLVLPGAAAVLMVTAARSHGLGDGGAARLVLGTGSVLAAIAEAAALARHGGAGWPAVVSLALSLGTLAAVAAAVLLRGDLRRASAVVAVLVAVADSAALAVWADGSWADAALTATVTASALLAAAAWSGTWTGDVVAADLTVAAGCSAAVSLAASVGDPDRLWLALLATGVALAVVAAARAQPWRHRLGWGSGVLLAASSWVRLALSDVEAPEAYTVPPALALLVVGLLRRRHDPSYRSWNAYGPGLALAMGPSLARALTDSGTARPLLLGLVAFAVLGAGVVSRLQAPLVLGAVVLAVDAFVQLSPYLADLYAVVPRWVSIGSAGLLLLVVGATYERRVSELQNVQRHVAGLG